MSGIYHTWYCAGPVNQIFLCFKAASEYHIRSLLTFSPNKNGNISDDVADDLISSWKKGRIPVELKGLFKYAHLLNTGVSCVSKAINTGRM